MIPLLLQHALIVAVNAAIVAVIGALVNRRLSKIEVHVNGRMERMERELAKLKKGD